MVSFSAKHCKPILLRDRLLVEGSIIVKGDEIADHNPWHFHPEIELLYCVKGKGTNFIGNHVAPIEEGELLMIGKNLPHTRKREFEYYRLYPREKPISIVLKFKSDFLGANFFMLPEFGHIDLLLQNAQRGMKFHGPTRQMVCSKLKGLTVGGLPALLQTISILDLLARTNEYVFLNPPDFLNESNNHDLQKINKVFEFTNQYFREHITLTEVSYLLNLTEAAFCRYFKARTRKSYFQYLTEVRVANVCKMLQEEDWDVAQACYASGFNNPSHFHKQFKKIVNLTPKEYRKKVQERIPVYS